MGGVGAAHRCGAHRPGLGRCRGWTVLRIDEAGYALVAWDGAGRCWVAPGDADDALRPAASAR
eukprot:gene26382-11663_t